MILRIQQCFAPFLFILFIFAFSLEAGALGKLVNHRDVRPVLISPFQNDTAHYQHNLAATAIFQNEAPYLKEWIEYHELLGVTKFYLYNNLSTDNYLEVLQTYIQKGLVEIEDVTTPSNNVAEFDIIQVATYQHALQKAKAQSKWLAIIDIDEFVVPLHTQNLNDFLKPFEDQPNIGGVCIAWIFFGTSGVKKIPEDRLMIETLLLNGGGIEPFFPRKQGFFKSIVKTHDVTQVVSPHYCVFVPGRKNINLGYDLAQINHYWSRDEDFFYGVKIPRRQLWGFSIDTALASNASWAHYNDFSQRIIPFVNPLRKKMHLE